MPSCETDEQERLFGSREADLGRVSMSFGEASVKDALRKATYLWFEAEFSSIHRSTSTSITASSEDALASTLRLQVASCEDDDYVHAKRNDKDVPQSSRRRKTRKASPSFVSLQLSTKDDRTVV